MGKPRLILIANGLQSLSGHHYMEARSFKEEANRQGAEVMILSHVDIADSIREELQTYPVFTRNPYWPSTARRRIRRWKNTWKYIRSVRDGLRRAPIGSLGLDDVLVCTLTKAWDMMAFAKWLKSIPRKNRPRLALNFMIDDFSQALGDKGEWEVRPSAGKAYHKAYAKLAKLVSPGGIRLTAGGEAYAKAMSAILGKQVHVAPLPVQLDFGAEEAVAKKHKSVPTVAYLGHMMEAKGVDLVGPAIRQVLASNADCHFVLQANPVEFADRWSSEIGREGMQHVTLHRGEMSQGKYQSIFRGSDIVLLPYRSESYRLRTSGIFAEAMAMGKVTVVFPDTWAGDMVRLQKGGGVIAEKPEAASLASALLECLKDWPAMSRQMEGISRHWREQMGMKSFVGEIMQGEKRSASS